MAKIVWAFNIDGPVNLDISIENAYTKGFLIAPKPFSVDFSVRSEEHKRIIEKELEEAREIFALYEGV
jgi:hypothetical protein